MAYDSDSGVRIDYIGPSGTRYAMVPIGVGFDQEITQRQPWHFGKDPDAVPEFLLITRAGGDEEEDD